jgi:thiol-disulfide isomerase/thioredoxin
MGACLLFFLCIAPVPAAVYMQDGTSFEVIDEDTLISDYLSQNDNTERIIYFGDKFCEDCRDLAPWFKAFVQAYPGIIEEYDLNEKESRDLLDEYKIAFSHDRVRTPSIFVEGADGSGFVLEGIESITLYLEPLVLGMHKLDDIFDEHG